MMTEEQTFELGRRAVAAGFRIMAGMLAISGERAGAVLHGRARWCPQHDDDRSVWYKLRHDDIPDFRDAATLGILRQQVVALVPGAVDVFAEWLEPYQKAAVFFVDAHGKPTSNHGGEPIWQPAIVPCTTASLWPAGALVACLEAAKEIRL